MPVSQASNIGSVPDAFVITELLITNEVKRNCFKYRFCGCVFVHTVKNIMKLTSLTFTLRSAPFCSAPLTFQSALKAFRRQLLNKCSIHVIGSFIHYDCFVQSTQFRYALKAFQRRSNHDPITFRSDCQFYDLPYC